MPSAANITTCGYCHAPIRWTITAANGVRLPVNADPDENGNQAVYTDERGVTRSRALNGASARELRPHEWQAMPHAATCTNPPPRRPRLTPGPVRRRTWRPR
jgi:hypothetical protein